MAKYKHYFTLEEIKEKGFPFIIRVIDEKYNYLKSNNLITFVNDMETFIKYKGYDFNCHISFRKVAVGSIAYTKGENNTDLFGIHIWDTSGNLSIIGNDYYPHEFLQEEDYNILVNKLDSFLEGKIVCSHCKKEIVFEENKHYRYFAGIYCQECWDREYKEKEAKESYN